MTNVVVTGGSGMLGHSLIPKLFKEGYSVTSLGRTTIKGGTLGVDYLSAESVHQTLDEIRPDFIVNLVALTDVDEFAKSHKAYATNVQVVGV